MGYEVGFEQGMRNRDVVMVPMLPYPEDTIRSILGQVRWVLRRPRAKAVPVQYEPADSFG